MRYARNARKVGPHAELVEARRMILQTSEEKIPAIYAKMFHVKHRVLFHVKHGGGGPGKRDSAKQPHALKIRP
jgi:hypothetical protein